MTSQRLLSVTADMKIELGNEFVGLRGDGSSVVVEVPRVSLAFQLLRALGPLKQIRERIARVSASLTHVGLTIVVRTPTRKLLTIGCDGNSWILKKLGMPNLKLHLS